eukprot:TRINITY_DN2694_c0_g2_i3.p1 TRINITY_DN2694_c0_g2~~TRINITY_DN2694_c0_g2_i3.p1  ORF type:complete len:247 (-),score=44.25 TRINITY_DN2694_c0_g2_i3:37-777(-)
MVVCEALNHTLKAAFAQPRPVVPGVSTPGHGMPSDHAQFSAFFAVYVAAFFLRRRAVLGSPVLPAWEEGALLVGLAANAVLTAASRVVLGYHTVAQVVVGGGWGRVWVGVGGRGGGRRRAACGGGSRQPGRAGGAVAGLVVDARRAGGGAGRAAGAGGVWGEKVVVRLGRGGLTTRRAVHHVLLFFWGVAGGDVWGLLRCLGMGRRGWGRGACASDAWITGSRFSFHGAVILKLRHKHHQLFFAVC